MASSAASSPTTSSRDRDAEIATRECGDCELILHYQGNTWWWNTTCTPLLVSGAYDHTEQWLTENAQKEGVVTLASGLQYKIIKSAPAGGAKPKKSEKCKCHYTGTLIDGEEFDSSRKRGKPTTFKPSGVIAGWTEALQLMSPGDKWMLYIPARLGYGSSGLCT